MSEDAGAIAQSLLDQARSGDGQALGELLESHRAYLTLLDRVQIGRRLQGKVDAADVVQDAFLGAYRDFTQFRGTSEKEFLSWLRQILAYVLANLVRYYQGAKRRDVRLERQLAIELDQSSQRLKHFLEDARWISEEVRHILTSEQLQRLREIDLQFKGVRAFEEQDIIEKLQLNAVQREQIRATLAQDFCAAFGDCHSFPPDKRHGPRPDGRHKLPPLPREEEERGGAAPPFDPVAQIVNTVLDKDQKQKWQELRGEPFWRFGPRPFGHYGRPGEPRP